VNTKNPSACVKAKWKVCKSAVALYCLYLVAIKRERVIKVLINPIIRTRTRHFCCVYHPIRNNNFFQKMVEAGSHSVHLLSFDRNLEKY
jgi:hypothetical protein